MATHQLAGNRLLCRGAAGHVRDLTICITEYEERYNAPSPATVNAVAVAEASDERAALLPKNSLLSLEEYLDMQQATRNETRFRALNLLVDEGAHSAKELQTALDIESNTLHYRLDALVDVGLVENRKRKSLRATGSTPTTGDLAR